jgi:hypothetical protein
MRLIPLALCCVAAQIGCAPAPTVQDDLGDALAAIDGCGDTCTADSPKVGTRVELTGRAHDVSGSLLVQDDRTLVIERFTFDGGGVDVRAIVAADAASLGSAPLVLSEDLRRPGGYQDAQLTVSLPADRTVDNVGAFSVWCVPFGVSFGDAEL